MDKSQNKSGERGFRLLGMVTQISLTMPPALLAKMDELVEKVGQSRAAVINRAVYRAVEAG